ncbi:putative sulfate exporter family transporter [Rheinheimera sp.]|uniref:putative sulfate exporter family transporter n=1 Tax=Rheinheimera sp. TaxID=1869214 RepID=UPI00307EE0D7
MRFVLGTVLWLGWLAFWLAPTLGLSPVLLALVSGMVWSLWQQRQAPGNSCPGWLSSYQPWALRAGLVLFGLQLPTGVLDLSLLQRLWPLVLGVPLVLVTGLCLGRKLGLSANTSWLVSAGLAFCGTSALFATQTVRKASPAELSQSLAAVLLMGLVSLLCYGLLPLTSEATALLIGATAPEVSQVVAASSLLPASVAVLAILLKLSRVLLLVPFLLWLPLFQAKGQVKASAPWFVLAVLLAAWASQAGWVPAMMVPLSRGAAEFLLVSAIWLAGVHTDWRAMRQGSGKVLLLALLLLVLLFSWFFLWLAVAGSPAPAPSGL